ncbi:MAG TPA: glycosyltransferase family 39 protein, partial [Allocoleopsis sp.]
MSRSFPTSKLSFRFSSILWLFIAIAVFLRVINLGSREFWYDEVLSLLLATGQKVAYQTPKDTPVLLADYTSLLNLPVERGVHDVLETGKNLLKGIVGGEPHPPLFFLTQHLWLRLFGNSEAAMRSLGVGLSIGAIASAFGLGRILLGQQGGLLFAALLAVNPYYLFHSLNVRMYGPLVFWTILSGWALLELIFLERTVEQERGTQNELQEKSSRSQLSSATRVTSLQSSRLLWSLLLIASVSAGLMTFYLFAYWLLALAAIVLVLDKSRWWQYGWRLGAGVMLTMPWVIWGARQQLHNADLNRFSTSVGWFETGWRHVQDVVQILGIHLLLGDWITELPSIWVTVAGGVAALVLLVSAIALWRQQAVTSNQLTIALLMGIFPLLVGLAADAIAGKFTIAFGWGRATIFILPGCLLLLVAGLERAAGQWKRPIAIVLLMLW